MQTAGFLFSVLHIITLPIVSGLGSVTVVVNIIINSMEHIPCWVHVSATSWSLVQTSPTECGVSKV
jgi:hypothetical protein